MVNVDSIVQHWLRRCNGRTIALPGHAPFGAVPRLLPQEKSHGKSIQRRFEFNLGNYDPHRPLRFLVRTGVLPEWRVAVSVD